MAVDIVLTLSNVVCGIFLTRIGIEMVNNPPGDVRWKRWMYRIMFSVLGLAVIVITGVQSARNSNQQQQLQREAEKQERDLSIQLSNANAKLDSISKFEAQFLSLVSQRPNVSPDATTKAFEAMALAVIKTAQPYSGPWQLSPDQKAKLLGLLNAPCTMMLQAQKNFINLNPPIVILVQDEHNFDSYNLAMQLKEMLRVSGCDAPIQPTSGYFQCDPFLGIKSWDGYTQKTRQAARLLQQGFMQIRPKTSLISGGPEPLGGHFEGIAIVIGSRNF
jgi:hypothetical protein